MKKLLTGLLVIGVLIAGAGYFLFSNLDAFVKAEIEKYGSQATGTKVSVSGVSISTTSGEGSLSNLIVANPAGYSSSDAFELGSISVIIDTKSILSDGPIVIHEVDVKAPQITFEMLNTGDNNLQAIERNAKNYSAPAANTDNTPDTGKKKERKIIISDLLIHDGQLKMSFRGKTYSAPLPPIHLTNIGKDTGGASPAQITKQVIASVSQVSLQNASSALNQQLNAAVQSAIKNGGGVSNSIKGFLR